MGLDQSISAGYPDLEFTKCNFAHSFFEKELGREIKNCEYADITIKMVIKLRNYCKEVTAHYNKGDGEEYAKKLLPIKEFGVFKRINPAFTTGTVDYDGSYYRNVQYLGERLDWFLELYDEYKGREEITYWAWW